MNKNCNCGNIEIEWDTKISELVARRCACEYCTKENADYVSDPDSLVKFTINNEADHKVIKHGTGTAEFHECVNCGLVLVTAKNKDTLYTVLNAKVLGISIKSVNTSPNDFNGESVTERTSRRNKSWCKAIKCGV